LKQATVEIRYMCKRVNLKSGPGKMPLEHTVRLGNRPGRGGKLEKYGGENKLVC